MGDFNVEPLVFLQAAWPSYLGGKLLLPNVEATCGAGLGRMLDYAFVSCPIAPAVTIEPDLDGPWRPHLGLKLITHAPAVQYLTRLPVLALLVPLCQGPPSISVREPRWP